VSLDADDLAEWFFLDIWQSPGRVLGGFDSSRGSLGTYLRNVATRRFKRWVQSHAVTWPTRRPSHDSATLKHLLARSTVPFDAVRFVNRLLQNLSARTRGLVEARFGMRQESVEDIAVRHGMSKTTAYRHIARVLRRRLRPIAEEMDPDRDTPRPEPV